MSKMFRYAAFVAALFLVVVSPANDVTSSCNVSALDDTPVSGGTSGDREDIRNALALLEENPRDAVRSVTINDTCPVYKPKDEWGEWRESAHCHWTRDVCIHTIYVYDSVVWHESGHALLMSRSWEENSKWAAVSNGVYGNKDGNFPRDGVLTSYGATNAHEDFAEWVAFVMWYQYRTPTGLTKVNLKKIDKSDERYIRHLKLLRDFGAITPEEYDKLAPLFTLTASTGGRVICFIVDFNFSRHTLENSHHSFEEVCHVSDNSSLGCCRSIACRGICLLHQSSAAHQGGVWRHHLRRNRGGTRVRARGIC